MKVVYKDETVSTAVCFVPPPSPSLHAPSLRSRTRVSALLRAGTFQAGSYDRHKSRFALHDTANNNNAAGAAQKTVVCYLYTKHTAVTAHASGATTLLPTYPVHMLSC